MTISALAAGICVSSGGIHALSVALATPKGTPAATIDKLNGALQQALQAREVIDALARMGIEAQPTSSVDANAFVESEVKRWPVVIQSAGIGPK